MRAQRVLTNETCNQNCWFCNARRPSEDSDFVAREAVRARIAGACTDDTKELVLTGGEPTMRNDIASLVRYAKACRSEDAPCVILETNGALIDTQRAKLLAEAGLDIARVHLVAWGSDACDAITRDPGGFASTLRGIRAFGAASVRVDVTVPIVRRNLEDVAAIPREIAAQDLPVESVIVTIPRDAPAADECASLDEIAQAVVAIAESARRVGLPLRINPATFVPPCIFERTERVAHLFALNRGNSERSGYAHVDICEECLVGDRCPGFPIPADSNSETPAPRNPVTTHRLRRRLTVVSSVEEQIARELVGRDILRNSAYGQIPEYTVRVNFHCNQACDFCFVSTHLPPASDAAVRASIERAGSEQAVLVLSGGEPTLNPRLIDYVRLAKNAGVRAIELQTNATRLADEQLTNSLIEAGVEQAMVSLHGSTAEISDLITGAPGTFEQTILGIDALSRTEVRLRLNFVFCQSNYTDFPQMVDMVAERWPTADIVFSFVGSHTDVVPRTDKLIPRFSDIMPYLLTGLERADAAGIEVCGFDSMCGLPLCLVPEDQRAEFTDVAVDADGGGGEFTKGEVCASCSARHRCYGIRRGYAELYGFSELSAFSADATTA